MTAQRERRCLLVVDDAPENLAVLNQLLKDEYRIKTALDGERALALAATEPQPDLILLDIVMPGIDGFEVCRRLRDNPLTSSIPVIFLTSRSQVEDEQLGFDVGGVDYLLKPVSPPIVLARVRTHLQAKLVRDFLRDQNAFLELEVARRTAEVLAAAEMKARYAGLQQELEVARRMQASILPRRWGAHPAVEIAAVMIPANEVGGDFYDYFLVAADLVAVVVADVCGKGVPAAFFMAITRTLLRAHSSFLRRPAECLLRLNAQLEAENEQMMFVTLVYGVLDLASGEFRYVNAGHDAPLLRRADGRIEALPEAGGMALALTPDAGLAEHAVQLDAGDTLLLFTDGITEAFDAEQRLFGAARLQASLAAVPAGAGAEAYIDGVVGAVRQFADGAQQSDDITCLALQYLGRRG